MRPLSADELVAVIEQSSRLYRLRLRDLGEVRDVKNDVSKIGLVLAIAACGSTATTPPVASPSTAPTTAVVLPSPTSTVDEALIAAYTKPIAKAVDNLDAATKHSDIGKCSSRLTGCHINFSTSVSVPTVSTTNSSNWSSTSASRRKRSCRW